MSDAFQRYWTTAVIVSLLCVVLVGGVVARQLYQSPSPDDPERVTPAAAPILTPDEQPGSPLVKLTPDAARHPHDETVRRLLQAYFDGINGRNYERWKTSVTAERVKAKSEREWLRDYRSTTDGSILVHRIDTAPQGTLRVLVSFTSTQDLSDAPLSLQEECIRWWLALPISVENGHWKIDTVPAGTVPEFAPCD